MGLTEATQTTDLRDYLAAERTLLARARTGLTLMGFGFVVARFGLVLQQLRATQGLPLAPGYGAPLWFGVALIGAIVVNWLVGWRPSRKSN